MAVKETIQGGSSMLWLILFFCAVVMAPGRAEAALQRGPNNLNLAGYWPLDEATSTFIGDVSGNQNNGTTSATLTSWVRGKRGSALRFGASATSAYMMNMQNMPNTNGTMTISFWYFMEDTAGPPESMVTLRSTAGGNAVTIGHRTTPGTGIFVWNWGGSVIASTSNSIGLPALNRWHHVVYAQDQTADPATCSLYVNGQLLQTSCLSAPQVGATNVVALSTYSGLLEPFTNGAIDDVRIYRRALSAQEINNLYRIGGTPRKTVSNQGLLAYFPMDEGTSTIVGDVSGNGRNGSLVGGGEWVNGKRGGAVRVGGGSDSTVEAALNGTSLATTSVAFWVRPSSVPGAQRGIFQWADSLGATMPFILLTYEPASVARLYVEGGYQISTTLPVNTWSHVGITVGSNVWILYVNGQEVGRYTDPLPPRTHVGNATRTYLGNGFGGFFQGSFDDFRVYDRELSPEEIWTLATQSDYLRLNSTPTGTVTSGLVGYWPFDGRFMNWTTNQALDASGNNNSGLLSGMSTSTSPMIGRIGQALNLDGANDLIDAGSATILDDLGSMSVCAWINPAGLPTSYQGIASKSSGASNGWQFYLYDGGGALSGLGFFNTDGDAVERATTVPISSWQHVCGTWDGNAGLGGRKLYLNGVELGSTSLADFGSGASDSPYSLAIGTLGGGTFLYQGGVDDVRVYDRELTAAEVRRIFNAGQ